MRTSRLMGSSTGRRRPSVLDWGVECNRPRIGQWRRRLCLDRLQRAVVDKEFIKHVLDRCLGLIRTGIAHVVMLETGINDGNSSLLAHVVCRDDAGVRLEHGVFRAE